MLPIYVISIFYIISYLLITLNVVKMIDLNFTSDIKGYLKTWLFNVIFLNLYFIILLNFKHIFLAFVTSLMCLISSLFLYYEAKEIDQYYSRLIIPYVLLNTYLGLLNILTYFINL